MYVSLQVKIFLSDVNETLNFSQQIFEKSRNMKFHENPSSGVRYVPHGWTDMKKPILRKRLKTIIKYF
jgi:hypothetical protein